jgi:uracil-DNA glycosylase
MMPPPVVGEPAVSRIMLVGQAPGDKEPILQRPFAWTAGKNMFKWFGRIGVDEATFRKHVYIAAMCRCFPGKAPKGGDRVPNESELENCRPWLDAELELLHPTLIIPVGKLAIARFVGDQPLVEMIGRTHGYKFGRRTISVIPLPHPSGASTWYHKPPGAPLLARALELIDETHEWKKLRGYCSSSSR